MPSFKLRSHQKELLDEKDIPFDDIKRNMEELNYINHYLGGHRITINGLTRYDHLDGSHIVEIGCGGGDNLRAIKNWTAKKGYSVQLTGIDFNPECIAFAKAQEENKDIQFICSDYREVIFENKPDIIFSSLFCHHFSDEEIISMLKWLRAHTTTGFFINDLHRHMVAYYSIKWLTRLFSKSYLVKNDAPLSVLRSFKRQDWNCLLHSAGIHNAICEWKWAFRWMVVFKHENRT